MPEDEIKRISGRDAAMAYPGGERDYMAALSRGRTGAVDDPTAQEMRANRRVNNRLATAQQKTASGPRGGAEVSFATGRSRDPMFYWKQNNLPYDVTKESELPKIRAYCNTPEAPVWMGDYSFKPIGEIVVGDEVIGWEWRQTPSGRWKSYLTRTEVLATQMRLAPEVVRITMESGRVIRCTPDHQWANPLHSPGAKVRRPGDKWTAEYLPAKVGRSLRHVVTPPPELSSEKERLAAAWLGGVYDGEATGERIAQDAAYNPAVCQRIKDSLDLLGIPWTEDARAVYIRRSGQGGKPNGAGARQDFINFLTWADPTRRQTTAIDTKLLTSNFGTDDRVASIESEGPGWVVSMQTGTGNYTAWGYASKNCRLLYLTHPVIASAIDIFAKYPLTGMEFVSKDEALVDFYSTLFFDQLNYEEYLVEVGKEYWTVGEAWPMGSFNETLGVWEDDELINPDDVEVIRSPFLKEPRFQMRLPETLRRIIRDRAPKWEYEALMRSYPELANFVGDEARMPVSNVLLKQVRFKASTFHTRGLPILMRSFRAIMQEEMLMAAMDSIADRLYTPLVLAKLGASATDLGTQQPWIPTEDDLADFEEALDAALAGDFRVLTHHFAVSMETVFGREAMPNMDNDFDRLTDRILQSFGLSKTMLSGAGSGETYAADALNRDVISQLLTTYQRLQKNFVRDRMLVVAEAQEHYDYEERNGKRYPLMEEVLEIDEETGEQRIVEQPKLLVPELKIKAMSMKDETDHRQFVEALRESGVPISDATRMTNIPIDLKEERERNRQENVDKAIEAQLTRKETYKALKAQNLPVPDDLKADFEPKVLEKKKEQDAPAEEAQPLIGLNGEVMDPALPSLGTMEVNDAALAPTAEDAMKSPTGSPLPRNKAIPPGTNPQRPPESDEQRRGMPRAAQKMATYVVYDEEKDAEGNVIASKERVVEVDFTAEGAYAEGPNRLVSGPAHLGMRRTLDKDRPLDEQVTT